MAQVHSPIPGTSYVEVVADIARGPRRDFLTWLRLLLAGQWSR